MMMMMMMMMIPLDQHVTQKHDNDDVDTPGPACLVIKSMMMMLIPLGLHGNQKMMMMMMI